MKVIYLFDWDIVAESSVLRKIAKKISVWETMGHEVHLVITSYGTNPTFLPKVKNLKVFGRKKLTFLPSSSLRTFIGKNYSFGVVSKYIATLQADLIYYRPSVWYPNIEKCISQLPTVLEFNSIDELEYKLFYNSKGFKYKLLTYGRNRINQLIKGYISVTEEIRQHYLPFMPQKSITIANGFDLSSVRFHKSEKVKCQDRAQLVFIGTPRQVWQGFEKVVVMAEKLPEFDFHVVGPSATELGKITPNLKVYGYLSPDKLDALYPMFDIGISTLNLHLKQHQEACSLKTREYVAHGLPVILGYQDTDLDGQEFILNLGNHPDNVNNHLDQIREFVNEYKDYVVAFDQVAPWIDFKEKERKRLDFMKSVLPQVTM